MKVGSNKQDGGLVEPNNRRAVSHWGKAASRNAHAVADATRRAVQQVMTVEWLQDHDHVPVANLGRQELRSYGRAQRAEATVLEPRTIDELICFFAQLRKAHAENPQARLPYCTFRAGGYSFHDQALNDEVVISLRKLDREIVVDVKQRLVEVQPGVTWGAIVEATQQYGLLPHIVVTTRRATAAGTLASDGICRASPIYGSESNHVEWLDVLTPVDEKPRRLVRPQPTDSGLDAQLFRAVIGGFGYLGVITRICYRLLSLTDIEGPPDAPVRVVTRLFKKESFGAMVALQAHHTCRQSHHRDDDTTPDNLGDVEYWQRISHARKAHQSIYSVAFLGDEGDKDGYGAVFRSWYERSHAYNPYVLYNCGSRFRFFIELMANVSWIRRIGAKLMWWSMRRHSRRRTRFVDRLEDYLFFMDVNRRVKEWLERFGLVLPVLQQTYVVPTARTAEFLECASAMMKKRSIRPTLFDVLFMPRDHILMSASYQQEGFACSVAFEDVRAGTKCHAVEQLLCDLTHLCGNLGGRVHFTKHVFAAPDDLCRMYGPQIEKFLALKRHCDPQMMLRNAFFERVFLAACPRAASR